MSLALYDIVEISEGAKKSMRSDALKRDKVRHGRGTVIGLYCVRGHPMVDVQWAGEDITTIHAGYLVKSEKKRA